MTNQEFSDSFTTILNSYNTQAQFGEQSSKREIVLDEYEKSVLLTQAQDIIVKSYFDSSLNQQGQGFDDSTRRQVDFSSLIKVAILEETTEDHETFDDRGLVYKMPRKSTDVNSTDVLFILNEKLISTEFVSAHWHYTGEDSLEDVVGSYDNYPELPIPSTSGIDQSSHYTSQHEAEEDGWVWIDESERGSKNYVIVPISYKEYDRMMSKPYAQPLKKQAWRLFQNGATGFDLYSELIPRWDVKQGPTNSKGDIHNKFVYKIRYVKRPRPIILTDLPDGLEIDGLKEATPCELNPILHVDVLNKAVELAITTRGAVPTPSRENA